MIENSYPCKHKENTVFLQNNIEYARCNDCESVKRLSSLYSLTELKKMLCKKCLHHHNKGENCL